MMTCKRVCCTVAFFFQTYCCYAELGTFAEEGPQFLLKNGDFRQLIIVVVVMLICLWGIRHISRNDSL